jgi:hypothetical protein
MVKRRFNMLKNTNLMLFLVTIIFMISCESPSNPEPTQVRITDVWFSEFIDGDNDGYYSDANLNFNLTVNKSKTNVFVVLGVRATDSADTAKYVSCFTSVSLEVLKDSDNTWFIPINNLDLKLTKGYYDFHLQVFLSSNPDHMLAELSPSSDLDIDKVAFELPEEDSGTKTEMLSYHDGDFEEGQFGFRGCVIVEYEKPALAVTCIINEIRIYIYESEDPANSSFSLKVYGDSLLYESSFTNNFVGWKSIPVTINISESNDFRIECRLPSKITSPNLSEITIGFDTETKDADRSYTIYPAPVGLALLDGELGIDVLVEYTTGTNNNSKKREGKRLAIKN